VKPDEIEIDITLRAKLGEWKQLRKFIIEGRDTQTLSGSSAEPFWTIIYRLGDVLQKVEHEHTNYEGDAK
jgi:hypothetical protein